MRYLASQKLEIIYLVKQPNLLVRQTREKLGIQPTTTAGMMAAQKDAPGHPRTSQNGI